MNRNLKSRIHAPPPGVKKIISLAVTESTQAVARELAKAGEREGTLIIAEAQTRGKGRLGRSWESPPGGLYMTIILNPGTRFCSLVGLSLLVSKTVAETLHKIYGIKTMIKPPNDVLAWHPKRRKYLKVSGVLTESSSARDTPEWVLLGVGVNLENTLPENLDKAVSVRQILGSRCRVSSRAVTGPSPEGSPLSRNIGKRPQIHQEQAVDAVYRPGQQQGPGRNGAWPNGEGSSPAFPDFLKTFFEIFWKRYSEWETGTVSTS